MNEDQLKELGEQIGEQLLEEVRRNATLRLALKQIAEADRKSARQLQLIAAQALEET
jgi:hypothetical protein